MANQLKEQYDERLQTAMENDEFALGRKVATVCVVAMALSWILIFAASVIVAIRFDLIIGVFDAFPLFMTLLFVLGIRGGIRWLAILLMIGGFAR